MLLFRKTHMLYLVSKDRGYDLAMPYVFSPFNDHGQEEHEQLTVRLSLSGNLKRVVWGPCVACHC